MVVGVSDIPRCSNDSPKYLVLKSVNDVSVMMMMMIIIIIIIIIIITILMSENRKETKIQELNYSFMTPTTAPSIQLSIGPTCFGVTYTIFRDFYTKT
jgi:uncharacterized integral membrane protein